MTNYIKYDGIYWPNRKWPRGDRMKRLWHKFDMTAKRKAGMTGYEMASFICELKVAFASMGRKNLVHFYNGDTNSKIYPSLKGGNTVVATYHQPPDFFYNFFTKCEHIEKLDGVFITSTILRELFRKYVDDDRIFYMPLAVDTDFFQPAPKEAKRGEKKVCLTVGNWLRDFETLSEVTRILESRSDIEFRVISLEMNKKYFEGLGNVKFFSGVPLDDYMKELHGADLLLLPFKSCTSNLAILESMACGIPIVTTDVGGIRDYINDSFAALLKKGDPNGMADTVADLLDDGKKRAEMSRLARDHSANFSWEVVSERMKAHYAHFGASFN